MGQPLLHRCGKPLHYCRVHRWYVCPHCEFGSCIHVCSHTGDLAEAGPPAGGEQYDDWRFFQQNKSDLVQSLTNFCSAWDDITDTFSDMVYVGVEMPPDLRERVWLADRAVRGFADVLCTLDPPAEMPEGPEGHDGGDDRGPGRFRVTVTEVFE